MNNSSNYADRWDVNDRIFQEENMYSFIESAADSRRLNQTAKALPLAKRLHSGQVRSGRDKVPYVYHPLLVACHALALGLDDDEIIAAALLHDVVEDCNITAEELPVSDIVKEAVKLLSFEIEEGETREEAKQRYYNNISKNKPASVVKLLDRCNNISSMASAFSHKKMAEYIYETEKYVMPLLKNLKYEYPECYDASFLLKYHMRSVLESLKQML